MSARKGSVYRTRVEDVDYPQPLHPVLEAHSYKTAIAAARYLSMLKEDLGSPRGEDLIWKDRDGKQRLYILGTWTDPVTWNSFSGWGRWSMA
jgi:hypothetical protein